LTYLAYRLTRSWEIKKRTFEDKKKVYNGFELAISKFTQALSDYRALQLLKPDKDANAKDMQFLFLRMMGIQSIWVYQGSMDVLRDYMEAEESDAKATVPKMKEAFAGMQQRLGLELGHYMMIRSDVMARYNQEMQRFKLTQPIKDSLVKMLQLIGQMGQAMGGSSLLAVMEYQEFDKAEDVGPWMTKMQEGLRDLSKALNDDLQSSR